MSRPFTLATIAVLLAATACGNADGPASSGAERVSSVAALPVAIDEIVLVVSGQIGQPNLGNEVHADVAGIESLGIVTATVYEPFVSAEVEFTGVPLDTVLAAIGVEDDAPLTWTALDEYQVNFSRGDVAGEAPILATRQNGQPIPVEDGGPIRIVFPDDSGPIGRDTNQWIWSLTRLEVG